MNTDGIYSSITTPPTALQIAKDEQWETCWIFEAALLPTDTEIAAYLKNNEFKTLAVEAVFEQQEGNYILGLAFAGHLKTTTPLAFISSIISATKKYADFRTYITSLDEQLVGAPYLLRQEPEVIRIGVVNHWFSLGPIPVWKKGMSRVMTRKDIEDALASNPSTSKTTHNYQGMSFVCNLDGLAPGCCHWIKSPCATHANDVWEVNPEMVQKYLLEWEGICVR